MREMHEGQLQQPPVREVQEVQRLLRVRGDVGESGFVQHLR
jgi:hypothetical protein